jgi:hypothetical protein
VQRTVAIRRPLYEVFAFVTTKENDPRWRRGVAEISRLSGKRPCGHNVPPGVDRSMRGEVESLERLKRLLETG